MIISNCQILIVIFKIIIILLVLLLLLFLLLNFNTIIEIFALSFYCLCYSFKIFLRRFKTASFELDPAKEEKRLEGSLCGCLLEIIVFLILII